MVIGMYDSYSDRRAVFIRDMPWNLKKFIKWEN